jgi:hypothetical protein
MKRYVVVMSLFAGLVASNVAFGFAIRGQVIGNGGNSTPPASNGIHRLYGTAGQTVIGRNHAPLNKLCAGFWCFGGPRVLAVQPPAEGSLPLEFALGQATPNPTRREASFRLALPKAARVTLAVYDVGGRQVGDVVTRPFAAGEHELTWSAPGAQAGIYFARLETDGGFKAKRTIVLVR